MSDSSFTQSRRYCGDSVVSSLGTRRSNELKSPQSVVQLLLGSIGITSSLYRPRNYRYRVRNCANALATKKDHNTLGNLRARLQRPTNARFTCVLTNAHQNPHPLRKVITEIPKGLRPLSLCKQRHLANATRKADLRENISHRNSRPINRRLRTKHSSYLICRRHH